MKGPQLTQRKIEKLRDALHVVLETDQVQHLADDQTTDSLRPIIELMLIVLGDAEREMAGK